MNTTAATAISIAHNGIEAKRKRYHCFHLLGSQCITIPNTNSTTTAQYSRKNAGMILLFHAPPIWFIMLVAVSHAT